MNNFSRQDAGISLNVAPQDRLLSERSSPSLLLSAIRLMRVHQWIKNAFVAAPLFFTPSAVTVDNVLQVIAGVFCFGLVASATYILNDLNDVQADRKHPEKRSRPIAAGQITPSFALGLLATILSTGLLLSFALSSAFGVLASTYFLMNVAYSLGLKNVSLVDVLVITLGFVLRVYAGAVLIKVEPSVWIIVCTGLVALFLALAKRRDDLVRSLDGEHRRSLDGYNKPFLDTSISIVLGALLISYVIYTTDRDVMERIGSEDLFLTVPFVTAGILRYLQIVLVEERSGAPTMIVLNDRFLICSLLSWATVFAALIYL